MEKFDKYFKQTSSFVIGTVLGILGTILFVLNDTFYFLIINILIALFLLIGIKNFLFYFFKRERKEFENSLFNLLFALILSIYPQIPYSILPIFIGCYFLLNGFLQLIDLLILIKNGGSGRFSKICYMLFYFLTSSVLVFHPLRNIDIVIKFLGIYFAVIGVRLIVDAILMIVPVRLKNRVKRKIRFSLPVFIECFIPYVVLNEINKVLAVGSDKIIYENKKNDSHPDLEVIVHVSPNGFNRMGHVDLVFQDEVISYGNYDKSSMKFWDLFGDGVIFITKKDTYIPFCIEHSKKTLFVFGIKLTERQKMRVQKEIDKLKKNLIRWYSPLEEARKNHHIKKEKCTDYSSCLYQKTKAKFYKVRTGTFKTYFVLGNNCCLLADQIIGKSGIDLLKMNGLITPGSYYEYLNREFMRKNSFVISRNIYNKKRKRSYHERKYFKSEKK